MGGSCSWWSRGSGASEVVYLPHGWFLFLVVQGQWGFPVAHCLTGSDLSAHLFHLGLQVSVLPDGHFGWEPSAQGVLGIKQGLKNKAAVTKATAKINATASNSTSRAVQGIHSITCAVFITNIKSATVEILRAPLLAGTETVLLALVDVTVSACSSEDKTTLFTLSVEMDRTAETINLNIESKQNDLLISQGATVSTTVIQATIAAEAAATTAASAVNMNTKITTKAPSLKREMFKAANLLMNW